MSNARELAQIPSTPSGRRNLIINGAMTVAQRGTSITNFTSNNQYHASVSEVLALADVSGVLSVDGAVCLSRCTAKRSKAQLLSSRMV